MLYNLSQVGGISSKMTFDNDNDGGLCHIETNPLICRAN